MSNLRSAKNLQGVLTHQPEEYNKCIALIDMQTLKRVLEVDVVKWQKKHFEAHRSTIDAHEFVHVEDIKDLIERNKQFRKSQTSWNVQNPEPKKDREFQG